MKKSLLLFSTLIALLQSPVVFGDVVSAYIISTSTYGCGYLGQIQVYVDQATYTDPVWGNEIPQSVRTDIYGPNGYYVDYPGPYSVGTVFYYDNLQPGPYTIFVQGLSGNLVTQTIEYVVEDVGENPGIAVDVVPFNCSVPGTITLISGLSYTYQNFYIFGPNGWSLSDGLPVGTSYNVTVPFLGEYTIYYSTGCAEYVTNAYISMVGVLPSLTASTNVEICSDIGSITLSNTGNENQTVIVSEVDFNWAVNAGQSIDVPVPASGQYTVTTYTASCPNDYIALNVEITLNNPAITITESHTDASGGQGNGSINLTVENGNPPYSYSWDNGATVQDITNLFEDDYTVVVTDSYDCTQTLTVTIDDASTIFVEDLNMAFGQVSIAPNPASGNEVILNVDAVSSQNMIVTVFNQFGQQVNSQKISGIMQGTNKIRLSLENSLPAGIYSMKVTGEQNQGSVVLPFVYLSE